MKRKRQVVLFFCVLFMVGMMVPYMGRAEEASPEKPYSGDIWHRSTLTGDWGGVRNDLAAKGITFDMSLTQVGQGVVEDRKSVV